MLKEAILWTGYVTMLKVPLNPYQPCGVAFISRRQCGKFESNDLQITYRICREMHSASDLTGLMTSSWRIGW